MPNYEKLQVPPPNHLIVLCKYCGGDAVTKYGTARGAQRYWCKTCRRKFADNKAMPGRRVRPEVVGDAIAAYYDGLSYRERRFRDNTYRSRRP
jgi:transposase-like protein